MTAAGSAAEPAPAVSRRDQLALLAERLAPRPASTTPWYESAAVLLVCFAVAYLRLGGPARRGVLWAEDGAVFLAGAHHSNLLTGAFTGYNGYALAQSRILAEIVSWTPLMWQGVGVSLAAALSQSGVALVVFHVVRAHARTRLAALLAALVVAAVPVGVEVVDNLANAQWFMLGGACLVPFWSPSRLPGRVASPALLFLTATTCPFAGLAVVLAVGVWLLDRAPRRLPLAVAGVLGLAVQGYVVATTDSRRTGAMDPGLDLPNLAAGFLRRVVGDGVLGGVRHGLDPAPSLLPGALVALGVAVVVAVLLRTGERGSLLLPALLLVCSAGLFAAPVYLTQTDTTNAYYGGRYYVAPVILLVIALLLVADGAWAARRVRGGPVLVAGAAVLVAAALVGMALSYRVPGFDPRLQDPGWQKGLDQAKEACRDGLGPQHAVQIPISPPGWYVLLPCAEVLDG